jgi:tetratricopeptide (TPR) repeat protein
VALQRAPGNAEVISFQAFVYRRMGRFQDAIAGLEQVVSLSPRDATYRQELGNTYSVLRDYARTARELDGALDLAPDFYDAASLKGKTFISSLGTTDTLRAVLQRVPATRAGVSHPALDAFDIARITRDTAAARQVAEAAPELIALQRTYTSRHLLLGIALQDAGNVVGARAAFTRALAAADAEAERDPSDYRVALAQAHALAGLGRRAEAVTAVERAGRLLPPSLDAFASLDMYPVQAQILARAGDIDGAVALLERVLAGPGRISAHDLRLHPDYDPLRAHPRFQALVRTP